MKEFEFDFSNVSDEGYTVIDPGRYEVKVSEVWMRKKEETGNFVLDMDMEITKCPNKKFTGENIRHFHAIKPGDERSKAILFRLMRNLNVIQDGDRGEDGDLRFAFSFGEKDDNGRMKIVGATVNGEERKVEGAKCIAVVTKNDRTSSGIGVARIEQVTDAPPAANSSPSESKKDNEFPW